MSMMGLQFRSQPGAMALDQLPKFGAVSRYCRFLRHGRKIPFQSKLRKFSHFCENIAATLSPIPVPWQGILG